MDKKELKREKSTAPGCAYLNHATGNCSPSSADMPINLNGVSEG